MFVPMTNRFEIYGTSDRQINQAKSKAMMGRRGLGGACDHMDSTYSHKKIGMRKACRA